MNIIKKASIVLYIALLGILIDNSPMHLEAMHPSDDRRQKTSRSASGGLYRLRRENPKEIRPNL